MITADSVPVYCWFGGSDCWTCDDLILWHKLMVDKYGKVEANLRFVKSFTNDTPIICEQLDCRSFNSTFRSYFRQAGILDSLYSGIGVIAMPLGFGNDLISNAAGAISNVATAGETATKTLKYIVPVLVIVAAVILIIWSTKKAGLIPA